MKYTFTLYYLLTAALLSSASVPQKQKPIMDDHGPALSPNQEPHKTSGDTVILTDVLGRDRSINIFAGFTRDISTVGLRLDDANANTTVLAPLNSAINSLPRKPWEDPKDYMILGVNAYEGEDGESRAHANLRRFVEAHIIKVSPWVEGVAAETMSGGRLWWETKDGKKVIQPGDIEVTSTASRVANGEIWILRSTRNYAY